MTRKGPHPQESRSGNPKTLFTRSSPTIFESRPMENRRSGSRARLTKKKICASQIYILSNLTDNKETQLTRGNVEVSHARWSPSGDTIAFLSTRALPKPKPDSGNQIWLMSASGGEPWALTDLDHGVEQFEWVDNATILFSAKEDPSLFERQTKESKDDSDVVDDAAHASPVRLFKLSVKDKKITRLTDNRNWIVDFAVSRDGKKAVAVERRELSYAWDQKTPPGDLDRRFDKRRAHRNFHGWENPAG